MYVPVNYLFSLLFTTGFPTDFGGPWITSRSSLTENSYADFSPCSGRKLSHQCLPPTLFMFMSNPV